MEENSNSYIKQVRIRFYGFSSRVQDFYGKIPKPYLMENIGESDQIKIIPRESIIVFRSELFGINYDFENHWFNLSKDFSNYKIGLTDLSKQSKSVLCTVVIYSGLA